MPWQRVDERWLGLVGVLAIAEVAGAVAVTHFVFSYLYFFVALWSRWSSRTRARWRRSWR